MAGFSEIKSRSELREYLFDYNSKIHHTENLVRYTTLKSVIRIIKDRKWRLGLPLNMNDKKELSDFQNADWNRIFYSCFMDEKMKV